MDFKSLIKQNCVWFMEIKLFLIQKSVFDAKPQLFASFRSNYQIMLSVYYVKYSCHMKSWVEPENFLKTQCVNLEFLNLRFFDMINVVHHTSSMSYFYSRTH